MFETNICLAFWVECGICKIFFFKTKDLAFYHCLWFKSLLDYLTAINFRRRVFLSLSWGQEVSSPFAKIDNNNTMVVNLLLLKVEKLVMKNIKGHHVVSLKTLHEKYNLGDGDRRYCFKLKERIEKQFANHILFLTLPLPNSSCIVINREALEEKPLKMLFWGHCS